MPPTPAEATVVASALSRQAIFDANLEVYAYELRYAEPDATGSRLPVRSARGDQGPVSGEQTGALILSAFAEFGLEKVVGKRKAFIAASARTLVGGLPLPVPTHRVALQIRDAMLTPNLLSSLRVWKDQGFDLALDHFEALGGSLGLLDLVDYVKVDVSQRSETEVRDIMELLRRYFAEPIATGIESNERLRFCASLGFTGFQGNFLLRPQRLQRTELPSSFVVVSQVLSLLQNPGVDFAAIEAMVKRDASLSVAVLKFLNSAAYGFRREVSSISQAVSMLGLNEFTKWLLLVLMAARNDKPTELLNTALVRARTCENVAKTRALASPALAFTVGLLSLLDALLDRPMEVLLEELPLTAQVRSAILEFSGIEGQILELVITREQSMPELDEEEQRQLTKAWLEALQWADGIRFS
jgi:EAL and modified HD-GYP domain-containing signal transduction protein